MYSPPFPDSMWCVNIDVQEAMKRQLVAREAREQATEAERKAKEAERKAKEAEREAKEQPIRVGFCGSREPLVSDTLQDRCFKLVDGGKEKHGWTRISGAVFTRPDGSTHPIPVKDDDGNPVFVDGKQKYWHWEQDMLNCEKPTVSVPDSFKKDNDPSD